ncbi:CorA family magnesium transporter [Sporobolomyces koalae]|uniref:CorA family magnesium transporter n=1 Tax=Sporobolomyces koalae TaxID=500713 RepID=UPI0031709BAD
MSIQHGVKAITRQLFGAPALAAHRSPRAPALRSRRSIPVTAGHARWYQHASSHAPASKQRELSSGAGLLNADASAQAHNGIAYSRHELIASWHAAAREVSPLDVTFERKDSIDVNYMILRRDGKIERPAEKLRKERLLSDFGLLPRDLRSLDAHVLDVRPSLIVCSRSMVLCTPVIRAIIAPEELVLIGADRENPICSDEQSEQLAESVQKVLHYLDLTNGGAGGTAGKEDIPFELRALEALLLLTVRGFKQIATTLQERVYSVIPQLRTGVSPAELRDLLECKRSVEDVLLSGRAIQSALSAILSEDEDLAAMYLTDKMNGTTRDVSDHQTAELLLEYYERRLDEVNEGCQRLTTLLTEVDSNISLVLASTRVRLQNLELQTAITTLAMGAGTAIAGFFGMNLVSGLEESETAFAWATGSGLGLMAVIMSIGWYRLVRARRSQLFLRSALRQRKDEELSKRWRVGPVAQEPNTRVPLSHDRKETGAEDSMIKKDGTQL